MNLSKLNFIGSILFIVLSFSLSAQKGTLRGSIIDDKTGQPIMFAGVLVVELTTGTETDLDGKYSIDLTPGQYTISVSYLGYNELKISNVIVEADVFREYVNMELNLSYSKYFYAALGKH